MKKICNWICDNAITLFVGIAIGAALTLLLTPTAKYLDYGSVGDWVGAISTAIAIIVTLKIATDARQPHVQFEVGIIEDMYHSLMIYVDNDGPISIYRLSVHIEYSANGKKFESLADEMLNEQFKPGEMHAFDFSNPYEDWTNYAFNPYHFSPETLEDRWSKIHESKELKVTVVAGKRQFTQTLKTKAITRRVN